MRRDRLVAGGTDGARSALRAAGVEATGSLTDGKPTGQVLRRIETHDTHLVVMGTRGLTGLKRLRLGSTAGHVVRSAPCNSLLVCVNDPPEAGQL